MDDCNKTAIPGPLSAKYYGSFAFLTVRDRLPVILTRVIDELAREKDAIVAKYTEESREELKQTIGRLSKLKNHLQTDKPLEPLGDAGLDVPIWNQRLEESSSKEGLPPSWFTSPWLLVECYMYRKIFEAFQLSPLLQKYDPFADQKEGAFHGSLDAIKILSNHFWSVINSGSSSATEEGFRQIVQINLWGNKCDLSMSAGKDNSQKSNPLTQLAGLQNFILVDDTHRIWQRLLQGADGSSAEVCVDFILDNAGFELFTDLCFADYLCSKKLAGRVRFHVKEVPWFVSDTTRRDLHWTLQTLKSHTEEPMLADLGRRWDKFFTSGQWEVTSHFYWTLPHDYSEMRTVVPDLYKELSQSHLLIFKGDLNYRKLTGDLMWEPTTPFQTALRGFHPTPLCTLRTLKANIVVGLGSNQAEESEAIDEEWMTSGSFAVVQFWQA